MASMAPCLGQGVHIFAGYAWVEVCGWWAMSAKNGGKCQCGACKVSARSLSILQTYSDLGVWGHRKQHEGIAPP